MSMANKNFPISFQSSQQLFESFKQHRGKSELSAVRKYTFSDYWRWVFASRWSTELLRAGKTFSVVRGIRSLVRPFNWAGIEFAQGADVPKLIPGV